MHDFDAMSPFQTETDEYFEYGYGGESGLFEETDAESPLDEEEAMELAAELLSVTSDEELDQFLGKLFKKVKGVVGKVARGPVGSLVGGALKSIAKQALPGLGAALGSVVPGLGTALGGLAGGAAANLLGGEYGGMSPEDEEFNTAQRYVKLATGALKKAALLPPGFDPKSAAKKALSSAAKKYAPALLSWLGEAPAGPDGAPGAGPGTPGAPGAVPGRPGMGGRWIRRGRKIVILGV